MEVRYYSFVKLYIWYRQENFTVRINERNVNLCDKRADILLSLIK